MTFVKYFMQSFQSHNILNLYDKKSLGFIVKAATKFFENTFQKNKEKNKVK